MKRKIYINVNLPNQTKKRLHRVIERWSDLPVKWTKEENFHLNLLSLGFVDDDSTYEVCESVARATQTEEIFDIELDTIKLSPSADDPRTIVATGKANVNLRNLVEKIEKELDIFISPKKEFYPHITLGKVRKNMWQDMPTKPTIEKEFPLVVAVESADIMASNFEDGDAEFVVVESCPLN